MPARTSGVCRRNQPSTHARQRPAARPMTPPRALRSRSTIEVIHEFERRHVSVVLSTCSRACCVQRMLRARVSSIPIMVVGAACLSRSAAARTRMRCTVPQAMPWSLATSLTARFVVVTAAVISTVSRLVTRTRTGNCTLVSVNDRRGEGTCTQAKRRFRTKITSGAGPCRGSRTRLVGRSLIRADITPQAGQPPPAATLSTSTHRPPPG